MQAKETTEPEHCLMGIEKKMIKPINIRKIQLMDYVIKDALQKINSNTYNPNQSNVIN